MNIRRAAWCVAIGASAWVASREALRLRQARERAAQRGQVLPGAVFAEYLWGPIPDAPQFSED